MVDAAKNPASSQQRVAFEPVTSLGSSRLQSSDSELLMSWIARIEHATAVTKNRAAAVTHSGAYRRPVFSAENLRFAPGTISLMADVASWGSFVVSNGVPDGGTPAAVTLSDLDGATLHRGYLVSHDANERLAELPADSQASQKTPVRQRIRQSFGEACENFEAMTTAAHLDSLLRDEGQRRLVMSHMGQNLTQSVDPDFAFHGLWHLYDMGVELSYFVPTKGLVHAVHGRLERMDHHRGSVLLSVDSATLEVDMAAIAECWISRPEKGPAIMEFFDSRHRCTLAVSRMGRRDPVQGARWEHVAEMACL